MFQTMTQIGKDYSIDAKTVGKFLYKLKIRDGEHTVQKGFPFEQAITHGIAKAYEGRGGDTYYRYNIQAIKDEFEKLVTTLPEPDTQVAQQSATRVSLPTNDKSIESKLKQMLQTLNTALETGEISKLYSLKADIADIYALLPQKAS